MSSRIIANLAKIIATPAISQAVSDDTSIEIAGRYTGYCFARQCATGINSYWGIPLSSRVIAKLAATVLLPTPPLLDTNDMTGMTAPCRLLAGSFLDDICL